MSAPAPVLVVDDDFDVRTGIAEILLDEGFAVATAANGAEALELMRGGLAPALVLLDLRMPVLDGEGFCRAWHEDPTLSHVPVVIVSADANAQERAHNCRATGLLRKPLDLAVLLDTVEQYASRH